MRGLCVLVLLLSACAAATPDTAPDGESETTWDGSALDYAATRPDAPAEVIPGSYLADLTLVELDEAAAKALLGIGDPTDIAPRTYEEAMGEIAAVNACYGNGHLLARPTIKIAEGEKTPWKWTVERPYLQDWELANETVSPLFASVKEGVEGTLELGAAKGDVSISADFTSAHLVSPMQTFETSLATGSNVKIQIPELVMHRRVGSETVRAGETAMFQLSRAAHDDGTRIRLLFVRLRLPAQ